MNNSGVDLATDSTVDRSRTDVVLRVGVPRGEISNQDAPWHTSDTPEELNTIPSCLLIPLTNYCHLLHTDKVAP